MNGYKMALCSQYMVTPAKREIGSATPKMLAAAMSASALLSLAAT